VDAYERKLVKQIEVAAATVEDGHNKPFVRLVKVAQQARRDLRPVSWMWKPVAGVQRQEVTVQDGDDLEQTTKRAIYANCRVGEIRVAKGERVHGIALPRRRGAAIPAAG
jgi:type III restriction enzyme